ncbi:MAG: hypothetical protein WCW93_03760 [Candidatus Paceibacterota bacterium]|jgi:hypothetical protein
MFDLKFFLGVQDVEFEQLVDVDSITKGDILYFASGYVNNAYASATTALLAGVAQQTVDNSGGSAGDLTCLVQMSPLAIYNVDTADTMTQAYVGYNCAPASATTLTSASQGTDITGVFKIMKMISASKCQGRLNFAGIADT